VYGESSPCNAAKQPNQKIADYHVMMKYISQ